MAYRDMALVAGLQLPVRLWRLPPMVIERLRQRIAEEDPVVVVRR